MDLPDIYLQFIRLTRGQTGRLLENAALLYWQTGSDVFSINGLRESLRLKWIFIKYCIDLERVQNVVQNAAQNAVQNAVQNANTGEKGNEKENEKEKLLPLRTPTIKEKDIEKEKTKRGCDTRDEKIHEKVFDFKLQIAPHTLEMLRGEYNAYAEKWGQFKTSVVILLLTKYSTHPIQEEWNISNTM